MHDLLIRGMQMPKSCGFCDFRFQLDGEGDCCPFVGDALAYQTRPDNCPLVELPPHGRLIDADAFEKDNAYFWGRDFINPKYDDCLCDLINAAPTIIPSNKKESE